MNVIETMDRFFKEIEEKREYQERLQSMQIRSRQLSVHLPTYLPENTYDYNLEEVFEGDKFVTKKIAKVIQEVYKLETGLWAHIWSVQYYGELDERAYQILKDRWIAGSNSYYPFVCRQKRQGRIKVLSFWLVERNGQYQDSQIESMIHRQITMLMDC